MHMCFAAEVGAIHWCDLVRLALYTGSLLGIIQPEEQLHGGQEPHRVHPWCWTVQMCQSPDPGVSPAASVLPRGVCECVDVLPFVALVDESMAK